VTVAQLILPTLFPPCVFAMLPMAQCNLNLEDRLPNTGYMFEFRGADTDVDMEPHDCRVGRNFRGGGWRQDA
jgi:hypothetical protein